ncbi:MAG: hypothetical protein P8Z37_12285, partial [Acidobacteriota bacterium]
MGTILGGSGNVRRLDNMPENWAEMTPGQKRAHRLNGLLNPPNANFVSKEAEEGYKVRAKRLVDIFNIEEPDRVP